jgi:hypothetical protein
MHIYCEAVNKIIFNYVHENYVKFMSSRMEEGRSAFKMLTGKPTGKRPLGRPRRTWEDNIRMDFDEIGVNARD